MTNITLHCNVLKNTSKSGKDFYTLQVSELKKSFYLTEQDVFLLSLLFKNSSNEETLD